MRNPELIQRGDNDSPSLVKCLNHGRDLIVAAFEGGDRRIECGALTQEWQLIASLVVVSAMISAKPQIQAAIPSSHRFSTTRQHDCPVTHMIVLQQRHMLAAAIKHVAINFVREDHSVPDGREILRQFVHFFRRCTAGRIGRTVNNNEARLRRDVLEDSSALKANSFSSFR